MTTLSTIDESKGAPPDFYTALMHGGLDTPMLETCDAQLRRIATHGIDQPTPYDLGAFTADALAWAYRNPQEPWSEATENVFAAALAEMHAAETGRHVDRLFCTWTRRSTYIPRLEHQPIIRDYVRLMHTCDMSNTTQLVGPLPIMWDFVPSKERNELLEDTTRYVQSGFDANAIEAASLVYFKGPHKQLTSVHQRAANDALLGMRERTPLPFACIEAIAAQHPDPQALQRSLLRLALKMATNPQRFEEYRAIGQAQCRDYLVPWLQKNPLPKDSMLRCECLLAAALLEQHAPGWIDPAVWQKQAPTEWERVQAAIPVLQSLNDVPWDPYHSERTVEDLAVLLAPTLGLNGQESAPLPALWDKCDLVQ